MAVIVDLHFMALMDVIVWTMLACVILVMDQGVAMFVSVLVLVTMLVTVGVRVFMSVSYVSVGVLVRMGVGVLVCMQMFVFMVALHCELLLLGDPNWLPNCLYVKI